MMSLEVRDLRGGYGRADVLHGIDLTVGAAEIVGLFGANGAGKTSLLRAVAGTLPVTRGDVTLHGIRLGRRAPWARVRAGLAHVPEGRHVFGPLTIAENLDAAALLRRDPSAKDAAYALFPKLHDRREQLAGSLSGGEQQMLAIARALVTRPQVLLVDEMSAGLAPVVVEQLVEGLVQVRESGVGVLLVEQSPHLVEAAIDRACLLEGGRIVARGTLEELGGADSLAAWYLGV